MRQAASSLRVGQILIGPAGGRKFLSGPCVSREETAAGKGLPVEPSLSEGGRTDWEKGPAGGEVV